MNTEELWALCRWVQAEIVDLQIPAMYSTLAGAVSRNTQPNQARQSFEAPKMALIDALSAINVSTLTQEQQALLEKLSLKAHLGVDGARELEDILFRNALDIATAAARLQENANEINNGVQKVEKLALGLDGLVDVDLTAKSDEVLLRVKFTGAANITNVVQLRKWSDDWFNIGRGLAMAHGRPPEDVRVVSATKGSIIIELGVSWVIAKTASLIILEALKVTSRVLAIFKEVETIRTLHLSNKKISLDIKKEAEKEKKDGATAISKTVVQRSKLNPKEDGDKVAALESAVKALVNFMSKGGEVDCYLPHQSADASETAVKKEIENAFTEIRTLEDNQRVLKQHLPGHEDIGELSDDASESSAEN